MYKAVGGVVSILAVAVMKAGPLLRVESSIFCPEYIEKTKYYIFPVITKSFSLA